MRSKAHKGKNISKPPIILPTIPEEETLKEDISKKDNVVIGYIPKSFIDDRKVDLWTGKTVFKVVMKTMDITDKFNKNNEFLKMVNEKRKKCLINVINTNYKDKKELKDVYLAIHEFWIKEFIQALDVIEVSDRKELIDAKVYKYYNYRILIKRNDESAEQALIDYLGLCWLYYAEKNIVSNVELDAIVSNNGFRMFMHMIIAIEFIDEFKSITFGTNAPKLEITDIRIISKEFDTLSYPSLSAIAEFPKEFMEHYATWKRIPYF